MKKKDSIKKNTKTKRTYCLKIYATWNNKRSASGRREVIPLETWIFGRDENVLEIANNRVYVID